MRKITPKISGKIIQGIDACTIKYLLKPPRYIRKRSSPEALDHQRRLAAIEQFTKAYLPREKADKSFFLKASPITPKLIEEKIYDKSKGIFVKDIMWHSAYQPYWQEGHLTDTLKDLGVDAGQTFYEKFQNASENANCYVRRYYKKGFQRPTLICLHGYGGGSFRLETWAFTIRKLIESYDIALMVLPYHAKRKEPSRRYLPPRFPSSDPRFTIEAIRQSHYDYQCLKAYLQDEGIENIALSGISLGGYLASLIAALDPEHTFIIPIMPIGKLTDIIEKQKRFSGTIAEKHQEKSAIDRLFSCVSPTSFPAGIGHKMTVLAGYRDQITGTQQAKIIRDHFQASLETFDGGHLVRRGFEPIWLKTIEKYSI